MEVKWAKHLRENFHQVLPHLFMGELTEWFVSEGLTAARRRVCGILEQGLLGGSAEVQELIQVSFIENLPPNPRPGSRSASDQP